MPVAVKPGKLLQHDRVSGLETGHEPSQNKFPKRYTGREGPNKCSLQSLDLTKLLFFTATLKKFLSRICNHTRKHAAKKQKKTISRLS